MSRLDASKPGNDPRSGGPGPFTTWVVQSHPVAGFLHQTSRRHRKSRGKALHHQRLLSPHEALAGVRHHWLRIFAPVNISWWIAVLFMIGAAHFALASGASLWPDWQGFRWIRPAWIGYIYFEGSFFFTAAAYCQWLQALNNALDETTSLQNSAAQKWVFFGWRGRNLGYLSATTQLIGTLLFNFNTGDALLSHLSDPEYDLLVWTPNILGSICFLAASQFAIMEYSHGLVSYRPKDVSWWIVMINMLGSILFMISALVSLQTASGAFDIPILANLGTFGGGLCFFIAAYLLIPEFFEKAAEVDGRQT